LVLITTGSQVALAYALAGLGRPAHFHFIESAARLTGPSMTGKLIRPIPRVRYYTQYPAAVTAGTEYGGSVFEGFSRQDSENPGEAPLRKVVVSLGTFRKFGFRRLVERLLTILPAEAEVLWQTGDTDITGLPIKGFREIPSADLVAAIKESDVVISHAGVGNALTVLQAGRVPVLVPRRAAFNEHVDDHQVEIADELASRDLALTVDASEISLDTLRAAASAKVVDVPAPAFILQD
jgi:UDP-N-acetylglucosamine--N-acetylmuramyl-(pentapeptide) pyrophosphoryl-undecaprenol N-acetylglucosamine transferase